VPQKPRHSRVAKVVIDKNARTLSAFDADGNLVAFYPASIGSAEKPAPSGEFKVKSVAHNPTYRYDPRFGFKGVKAQHKFTIRPGPKSPVGVVWIDLSAPSYGIHGTPSPEKIGKTESHGCIRLTNWDALDLAGMVHRGTVVDFVG
jgi:lipoprotein-anchoring transpeptidase ErfK/SrfK